ncbi:MAG TPA: flippase [Solirubrobacteraceae bacterium]|jgi:PST family polysaccharide transporter|nr:flippase [Solirubrobacteraceae bacterium]
MQVVVRVMNLALGVVVTALLARTLRSAGYGQWSTIFAVLSLTGYFMSFGAEGIVVREAARNPESEHEWLGAMVAMRLIALGPVMLISLGVIALVHQSQAMLLAGLILVVFMPFDGVGALQLVFQLRVNNRIPMVVLTLRSVLWAIAVFVIYERGGGLVVMAIALVSTNLVGSIVQTVTALRLLEHWPRPSRARLGELFRQSLPLGLTGMLVIGYGRIDQVIILQSAGSRAAGLYGAVYSVLDRSHFVPISVLVTLAPIMAAAWPADPARMLRAARLTAELMAITSLGALSFASVAAKPLVRLFFGSEFTAAAPALPVLGAAFVFICFGYLNGNLLVTLGLQGRFLRISLVALAFNLIGNVILVPLTGFMGAAWMTLATEVLVCGMCLSTIVQKLERSWPRPGRMTRTVLAAALLFGALSGVNALGGSLAMLVLAACVLYPALLLGLGALGRQDVEVVLRRTKLA